MHSSYIQTSHDQSVNVVAVQCRMKKTICNVLSKMIVFFKQSYSDDPKLHISNGREYARYNGDIHCFVFRNTVKLGFIMADNVIDW